MFFGFENNDENELADGQCPTGRVFQNRVGSGIRKIPGSGSGSGRVGVLKNTIGYFRVSFLLSGNSGYSGYFRVIPGIPGNSQIICNPKHRVIPETSGNTQNFGYYPKFRVIPDISGYPLPEDFQNWIGSGRVLKKIPGSGSGSGTRWALHAWNKIFDWIFQCLIDWLVKDQLNATISHEGAHPRRNYLID